MPVSHTPQRTRKPIAARAGWCERQSLRALWLQMEMRSPSPPLFANWWSGGARTCAKMPGVTSGKYFWGGARNGLDERVPR